MNQLQATLASEDLKKKNRAAIYIQKHWSVTSNI